MIQLKQVFLLQFHLNEAQVGLAFLPAAMILMLSALVVGRLCDKFVSLNFCCCHACRQRRAMEMLTSSLF